MMDAEKKFHPITSRPALSGGFRPREGQNLSSHAQIIRFPSFLAQTGPFLQFSGFSVPPPPLSSDMIDAEIKFHPKTPREALLGGVQATGGPESHETRSREPHSTGHWPKRSHGSDFRKSRPPTPPLPSWMKDAERKFQPIFSREPLLGGFQATGGPEPFQSCPNP